VTRLRTERSGVQIPAWSEEFSLFFFFKCRTPHFLACVGKTLLAPVFLPLLLLLSSSCHSTRSSFQSIYRVGHVQSSPMGSVPGLKTVSVRTARTNQGLISVAASLQNTVHLHMFHSFRDPPSYSHVATLREALRSVTFLTKKSQISCSSTQRFH